MGIRGSEQGVEGGWGYQNNRMRERRCAEDGAGGRKQEKQKEERKGEMWKTEGLGMATLAPAYSRAARFYTAPIQGSSGFAARDTNIAVSPGKEFEWLPAHLKS